MEPTQQYLVCGEPPSQHNPMFGSDEALQSTITETKKRQTTKTEKLKSNCGDCASQLSIPGPRSKQDIKLALSLVLLYSDRTQA